MPAFPLGAAVTGAQLDADPYAVFARLRPVEPVTWVPALGQWLVTRRDIAMDVLRDPERFRTDSDRSPIRDSFGVQMLSVEGEDQRRFKTACAPPFNTRAANEARTAIAAAADRQLAALAGRDRFEVRAEYAAPIALEMIARTLGIPGELQDALRGWYDTFVDALANYTRDPATRDRAHAAARAFRTAMAPRLAAPDAADRSLLAQLVHGHPRVLDDEEILSNLLIVLFGGIETTEGIIANTLWALLLHPDALARARADDADLQRCVEESLRWEPAVQTCTRYTLAPVTLHGVEIPAGAVVQVMLGAMNRDPAHVADPDRFDPWREAAPHSAFGFGRHFCLGAALVRVEAEVALRRLLDAYPVLVLDPAGTSAPFGREFRKVGALTVRTG